MKEKNTKTETKFRPLNDEEKAALLKGGNTSPDNFASLFTACKEGRFDASFFKNNVFTSRVKLPDFTRGVLSYHDLKLEAGVYNSRLSNVEICANSAVHNVAYMENYSIEEGVILFNIQEMICTKNAKFGESLLNEGEGEEERICLEIINEGGGRKIGVFKSITAADAYIMSKYRDEEVQKKFRFLIDKEGGTRKERKARVGRGSVIKNTLSIKDTDVGEYTYIKGALKIKNVTILSSEKERSQIGEAVVLVNGIMQEGSKAFYSAIAVRFVLGENSVIKYGSRLINSVLADNSTVSCCEILNNLIYPFHEQHHNSSFLIASLVQGQSNIASGATIGSNHNSRAADGEMKACRGFWPGLNVSLKHNSLFAPFVMIEKGSYKHEMKILYPFSLVSDNGEEGITTSPAWLLYSNPFFILRNKYKFKARDKRKVKRQRIQTNPFACDTAESSLFARALLINLMKEKLESSGLKKDESEKESIKMLEGNGKLDLEDKNAYRKSKCTVHAANKAYKSYTAFLYFFSVDSLRVFADCQKKDFLEREDILSLKNKTLYTKYVNAGGEIMAKERLRSLLQSIRGGKFETWETVHEEYTRIADFYTEDAARFSLYILEILEGKKIEDFDGEDFEKAEKNAANFESSLYETALKKRHEDYTDSYRVMVYDEEGERDAVLGSFDSSSFIKSLEEKLWESKNFKKTIRL